MTNKQNDEDVIYIKPIYIVFCIVIIAIIGFGLYSYVQTLDDYDYIFAKSYKYDSVKITLVDGEMIPVSDLTVYCDGQSIPFEVYNQNHKIAKQFRKGHYMVIDESYYNDDSVIEIHKYWHQIYKVTI